MLTSRPRILARNVESSVCNIFLTIVYLMKYLCCVNIPFQEVVFAIECCRFHIVFRMVFLNVTIQVTLFLFSLHGSGNSITRK